MEMTATTTAIATTIITTTNFKCWSVRGEIEIFVRK